VRGRRLVGATLLALVAGVALLVPFDYPVTLALGVTCLLAFIALGVFTIATPEFLASTDEEEKER
jgi:hypothetical protein